TNCTNLYPAGNADQFHENYLAFENFITLFLQKLKITKQQMLSNCNYERVYKLFNVKIYFHIRTSEAIRLLDKSFKNSFTITKDKQTVEIVITNAVLSTLKNCWSPQIFINALFYEFWKLLLQILCKYTIYLKNFSIPDP